MNLYTLRKSISSSKVSCKTKFVKYKYVLVVVTAILLPFITSAQLAVTQNANATTLSQLLAGAGVTITNVTKTCDNNGTGTFNNVTSNLGINQGIVLASGKVQNIGQSASNFASTQFTNGNDAQLSTLTTGTIYDKCILEFDITPQGSTLKFNYVFASEEYPEFVCSPFNDVFGFFISGPNPGGGNYSSQNIATIPNSTLPVCINSVNGGTTGTYMGNTWNSGNCISLGNTQYYVDNNTPTVNPNIVYDGMTTVLTASASVVPCQTYHLKIAIADVGDRFYDSGVFLEAYSFTSTPYNVSITSHLNNAGYTSMVEGCEGGYFNIAISPSQSTAQTIHYNISGSATNGSDYSTITDSVIIPANQTSVNVNINPIQDNIAEGTEKIVLALINPCTGAATTADSLTIVDVPPALIGVGDSTLCFGQSTQLTSFGGTGYTWSPATGLSNPNISNPIATPTTTTTYSLNMTVGVCNLTGQQTIYVSHPNETIAVSPSATICNGGTAQLTANTTGGTSPYTYLWNTTATTQMVSTTTSNNFSVTSTDAWGCTASATSSITVLTLSASATSTNVNCFGGNNGTVTTTITGGSTPYSFNWGGGVTTQNRSSVTAGTYTVTVTDNIGCSATAQATVTQPATAVTPTLATTNVSCFGGNDGTITTTTTGGNPPYTYNWVGGITTQNRNNLTAGTYHLTVTDASSCTATASATITQSPSSLAITSSTTSVICNAGNTGSITLNVTGGAGGYTYNWGGGITTQNRTNIGVGTYTVTVTDASTCTATASATVGQAFSTLTVTPSQTNILCNGSNTGAITLSVTGGSAPYTYSWTGGSTTQNRTNLAAGSYSVTVSDANLCSTTASATITQPAAPLAVSVTSNNVNCFGASTGNITSNTTGGTTAYSYNWGGGITTANRTNIPAGTYNLTVTDNNGCSATAGTTITQPAAALNVSTAVTNVLCFGANTGAVNTTVTGGTIAYTYNWGGGITTANRSNLVAGTYNVTVTDGNSCTASSTNTITQPAAPLNTSAAITTVSCNGGNNGSIILTTTGGTTAYSYNWGGGINTQNRSGLTAGTYTYTVTDANLCSVSGSAMVTEPATAVSTVVSATNVSCYGGNNGTITLTTSGGVSPYSYNWTGAITTQNRTGLSAGSYSVTITDNQSCSIAMSVSITQPAAPLSSTTSITQVSCFGSNTGAVNLTPAGGTAPYTYNWGGGITTQNRINVPIGTYNVTITDANSCTAGNSATVTQPPSTLTASATATNVSCRNGNNGSINVTVNGGAAPYHFLWNDNDTNQNRTNLTAASYQTSVTDNAGCVVTTGATVSQPNSGITATPAITDASCYGGTNGTITLTVSGGNPAYSFDWGSGINTQNRTGLTAGTYAVTITDATSCSASFTATVLQPSSQLGTNLQPTSVQCFGANNGTITVTSTGGTPPYSYKWDDGSVTQNRNNLAPGTYTVTVTDANSCFIQTISVITEPVTLVTAPTQTNVSCLNGNNGSIHSNASGGTTPYTYNWSSSATTADLSNLYAGTYSVVVTDANTCTASASATITQPTTMLTATTAVTNVSCFGGSNGSVTLNASGGVSPYTYNWTGGATTQTISNLAIGTYNVTFTDSAGCSATGTANITEPASALTASATTGNVSCFAGNNGYINVNSTGGTSPYTYDWGSGITTQNRNNITAGTYTATITDANSCTTTISRNITQPASGLNAIPTVTNVSCYAGNNGTISIATTGGTSPYTYNWNGGGSGQNRNNLSAGNYTVTIFDLNGCNISTSATVAQPAAALAANGTSTPVSCNGGSNGTINVTATGGTSPYTYAWTGGATGANRTNLTAGNYTVTVNDAQQCSTVTTVAVTQPNNPITITLAPTDVACFGGNNGYITSTITGGTTPYQYAWTGGATTANRINLVSGTYSLTVTDNGGCSASSSAAIAQPSSAVSGTITTTNVSCFGGNNGTLTLTPTGGTSPYNFNWGNNITSQNRNNLTTGSYTVTITDSHSCIATVSATISQPLTALNPSTTVTNVNCMGGSTGSITASATGGTSPYGYNWGNGVRAQSRTNLSAGTYLVTVTDNNSCSATASGTIIQPAAGVTANTNTVPVSCFGGSDGAATVTATGGTTPYTYNWGNGNTNTGVGHLTAGSYTTTVTDANGCSTAATAIVTAPTQLAVSQTATNPSCNGYRNGQINLTVSGGTPAYSYNWSDGATVQNISTLGSGNYSVTVTDAHGCTAVINQITLADPATLTASATTTSLTCVGTNNGSIITTTTGGVPPYAYKWNNGNTNSNLTAITAGTYIVTVTDVHGCTETATAVVGNYPMVDGIGFTVPLPCANARGNIDFTITDGTAPYTFNWNTGATTQDLNNVHPGTYHLSVQDANGCKFDTSFVITNLNTFTVNATGSTTIKMGESVNLTSTSSDSLNTSFVWNYGQSLSCTECANAIAKPAQTTTYTVVGTDANGCVAQDTVTVNVIEDHTIFVPNAFTPNGDGVNDVFQIFGNLAGVHSIDAMVFDRWGEKVFESSETNFQWDGTYKGVLEPPSVFVYLIKVSFLDGREGRTLKGSVTLIR